MIKNETKNNTVDLNDPIVKAIWEGLERFNDEYKRNKENSIQQTDFDIDFRNGIYGEMKEIKRNE